MVMKVEMDIQTEKAALIQRLQEIDDSSLIQAIKHLMDDGLEAKEEGISIEQYNMELDEANARMDAGESVSHDDVKKESATWLN